MLTENEKFWVSACGGDEEKGKMIAKKRQEAIDKLNADPQAMLAWIQRMGRLHEEAKREGPTFMRSRPKHTQRTWIGRASYEARIG